MRRRRGRSEFKGGEEVALVKWFGLGSALLYSPLFRSLKKEFGCTTFLFTNPAFVEILSKYREAYDKVFPFWEGLKFFRNKFKWVLTGEFTSNISLLLSSLLGEVVFGFHPSCDVYVEFNEDEHFLWNLGELYSECGGKTFLKELFPPQFDEERGKEEVRKVLGSDFFLVNPNVSSFLPQKEVPFDVMGKFVKYAAEKMDLLPVIIGAKGERKRCEEFLSRVGVGVVVAGQFSVDGYLYLFRSASFIITTDSAPLHISQTFSLPSVSFFGPESPRRYGPVSPPYLVVTSPLSCSPCLSLKTLKKPQCNENRCMRAIEFEKWVREYDSFLSSLPPRK